MNIAAELGTMHAASLHADPKHVAFVFARYHYVARMLQGSGNVLEVGCGDGTGAHLVRHVVNKLYGLDVVPPLDGYGGRFIRANILDDAVPIERGWDAVFALDVLEHIAPDKEHQALANMTQHLNKTGVCIIGMPSLESQVYASELSKRYHVNTKTEDGLRATMLKHFHNVFMFGQNDTTLHCGFGPMTHYRLALCAQKH